MDKVEPHRYINGHGRLLEGRFVTPSERQRISRMVVRTYGRDAYAFGVGYASAEAAYRLFMPPYPTADVCHDEAEARATALLMLVALASRYREALNSGRASLNTQRKPEWAHAVAGFAPLRIYRLMIEWSDRGWYLGKGSPSPRPRVD